MIGRVVGLVVIGFVVTAVTAAPEAALFDELTPLYPDASVSIGAATIEQHVPRGAIAGVHVLIRGLAAGDTIAWSPTLDPDPGVAVRMYRLHDVPVEENTGLASRTEQFDGRTNPHVIRRAPFRVFEAMEPVSTPIVADGEVVALRFEWPVDADATAGRVRLTPRLSVNGQALDACTMTVSIHDTEIPPIGRDTLAYTNWFSPSVMATDHGVDLWSEPFWTVLGQYADLMARGRQNTFWVRWSDMFEKPDGGSPRLNRARLERYVSIFERAGLHWIEGAPIAGRPGGDWSADRLELRIVNRIATSDAGAAALASMASQLMTVIRANGWEDRWLQHLADEPTDTNAADYRQFATLVRGSMPGIPIVEATMCESVAGAVDIWCPQVQIYQQKRDFYDGRRAAGERIWVYTCLVPGGPWINRLLDMERLRPVYVGWAAAAFNLHGFLHWGLNHHKADPFEFGVVDHPATPNTTNKLPAGDTHLVYPGPDGPWSGVRFEAHRIGLEDHALLADLLARDPDAARAIIATVFRAFDDYETDVAAYRAARRHLLDTLDRSTGSAHRKKPATEGIGRGLRNKVGHA